MDSQLREIPLEKILVENEFNSRHDLIPMDVIELARNIKERGLIQPVLVIPYSGVPGKEYKLIAGFRRTLAHRVNNMPTIQAIVRNDLQDEEEQLIVNLSENLNRADLNILEEAHVLMRLQKYGWSKTEWETRLGRSWPWIDIRLKLLELPGEVQAEIKNGQIKQAEIRKLFQIYVTSGEVKLYEAVKKVKDAMASGKKSEEIDLSDKTNKQSKRMRTRTEMHELQDIIRENFGNGLHTRILAWASGEISTEELMVDMQIANKYVPIKIPEHLDKYNG